MKVLIIEDSEEFSKSLLDFFNYDGHSTDLAPNLSSAYDYIAVSKFDIILLDIMLPDGDGRDFLKRIRKQNITIPVIVMTARSEVSDKIDLLDIGADDYIIKPFDPSEVVARIRARLRKDKSANTASTTARFEGWIAHFDRYMLENDSGQETPFSHAEGEVLRLFLESPKRLISRAHMQETLGGAAGESFDRAMDVRISRLRTKLNEDPKNPQLIKTIYGAGYIFLGDVRWER